MTPKNCGNKNVCIQSLWQGLESAWSTGVINGFVSFPPAVSLCWLCLKPCRLRIRSSQLRFFSFCFLSSPDFFLFSLYFFLHNCGVISVGQGSDHWSSLFSCLWEKVGPPAPRRSSLSEFWHCDESLCRILISEESLTFLQTLPLSQTRLSYLPLPPCCLVPLFQSNYCSGRRK